MVDKSKGMTKSEIAQHMVFAEKYVKDKEEFEVVNSWQWVQPTRKGYKMKCCDCGLVHVMDFRIAKSGRRNFIQFRAKRI